LPKEERRSKEGTSPRKDQDKEEKPSTRNKNELRILYREEQPKGLKGRGRAESTIEGGLKEAVRWTEKMDIFVRGVATEGFRPHDRRVPPEKNKV